MKHRGSLLIEVLLSAGILAFVALMLTGLMSVTSRTVHAAKAETTAVEYAKESMEELTAIKNVDFSRLTLGHKVIDRSGPSFELRDGTNETVGDGFSRTILLEQAVRDTNGKLAESGTPDPQALRATVTVRWIDHSQARTVTLVNYFTNWKQS